MTLLISWRGTGAKNSPIVREHTHTGTRGDNMGRARGAITTSDAFAAYWVEGVDNNARQHVLRPCVVRVVTLPLFCYSLDCLDTFKHSRTPTLR